MMPATKKTSGEESSNERDVQTIDQRRPCGWRLARRAACKRMKAGIEQRSGGKIKVDIYPSNQLGQLPAVVEGVALGTIEAAASANGFWVSLEPRFQVLDAPGLFDDLIHGNKMLNDPGIRARLATWGADKGVEILTPGLYSPLMILTHKAIRTISDFQGQKIRTQGGAPIQVEPLKKTGAIPVSLPLG